MPVFSEKTYSFINSQPEPAYVARLRHPRATRVLIIGYFAALAIALLSEFAALRSLYLFIPFLIFMIIAMTCWSLLRQTIQAKDLAPRDQLDDYEASILAGWRRRAMTASSAVMVVTGVALITIAVTFSESPRLPGLCAVIGMFLIYAYLFISTLPAVGFALSFNRPIDED